MWLQEATVRNVTRAMKEVQAFDLGGDYRPAARAALKRILESRVEEELTLHMIQVVDNRSSFQYTP